VSVRAFLTAELPFLRQIGARKRTRVVLEPIDAGHLIAHPTRIRRVLDNLVSNAVKFSPCGSTIFIHAYQEGGYWRIWVQDQGPGIAPAERRKLFGKFARLSAQPTGQESSTGLGLHVCREIVQAHGGDIGVENAAGRGALFWFTLKDATGEADAHLETGDASGCRDIVPPTSE
jgi:signal transduction histidine kinase